MIFRNKMSRRTNTDEVSGNVRSTLEKAVAAVFYAAAESLSKDPDIQELGGMRDVSVSQLARAVERYCGRVKMYTANVLGGGKSSAGSRSSAAVRGRSSRSDFVDNGSGEDERRSARAATTARGTSNARGQTRNRTPDEVHRRNRSPDDKQPQRTRSSEGRDNGRANARRTDDRDDRRVEERQPRNRSPDERRGEDRVSRREPDTSARGGRGGRDEPTRGEDAPRGGGRRGSRSPTRRTEFPDDDNNGRRRSPTRRAEFVEDEDNGRRGGGRRDGGRSGGANSEMLGGRNSSVKRMDDPPVRSRTPSERGSGADDTGLEPE